MIRQLERLSTLQNFVDRMDKILYRAYLTWLSYVRKPDGGFEPWPFG